MELYIEEMASGQNVACFVENWNFLFRVFLLLLLGILLQSQQWVQLTFWRVSLTILNIQYPLIGWLKFFFINFNFISSIDYWFGQSDYWSTNRICIIRILETKATTNLTIFIFVLIELTVKWSSSNRLCLDFRFIFIFIFIFIRCETITNCKYDWVRSNLWSLDYVWCALGKEIPLERMKSFRSSNKYKRTASNQAHD